uniref:H/ACA ribonucleoprotein complex subunit n=1 Tax=Macrostomum lignano TaxID=282301 RepID=A0A1I8G9U8_9PLAT
CSGELLDSPAALAAYRLRPGACLRCLPDACDSLLSFDAAAPDPAAAFEAAAAAAASQGVKRRRVNGTADAAGRNDDDGKGDAAADGEASEATPAKRQLLAGGQAGGGPADADERELDDYLSRQEAAYRGVNDDSAPPARPPFHGHQPHHRPPPLPLQHPRWPKPFGPRGPPHPHHQHHPHHHSARPPMFGAGFHHRSPGPRFRGGYQPRQPKFPAGNQQQQPPPPPQPPAHFAMATGISE